MSVFIKDMDMPENCFDCDFCSGEMIYPDSIFICEFPSKSMYGRNITEAIRTNYRHHECPFVEVPTPHGRLVDAQLLKKEILSMASVADWCGVDKACDDLDDAPTVIEAEG